MITLFGERYKAGRLNSGFAVQSLEICFSGRPRSRLYYASLIVLIIHWESLLKPDLHFIFITAF